MKKKILYIAAIIICLSIITSGTLAYFTAADTARNVITTGGVSVRVVEQVDNGILQPYPSQPIPVIPTAKVSKIVSVRNLEQPAWVRVRYDTVVYDAAGNQMDIPAEEREQVFLISPDTSSWTLKNGWWHYNTALNTNETTKPLFEQVVFSGPHMDNKYQNCTVEIIVTAQAVQTAHNDEAFWPEA